MNVSVNERGVLAQGRAGLKMEATRQMLLKLSLMDLIPTILERPFKIPPIFFKACLTDIHCSEKACERTSLTGSRSRKSLGFCNFVIFKRPDCTWLKPPQDERNQARFGNWGGFRHDMCVSRVCDGTRRY
jgi:hypothetical protein